VSILGRPSFILYYNNVAFRIIFVLHPVNPKSSMSNKLSNESKSAAVSMLCEGSSIRSIERMTGIHRDTIMRLGVRMGEGCKRIMDERLRGLNSRVIEVDEVWGFVGMKAKTAKRSGAEAGQGDVWTWIALDAETKLVPTFAVGGRNQVTADSFIDDLASRLTHRVQISTDGLTAYQSAIERAFGTDVDYGTIVKTYSSAQLEEQRRYSPPEVVKVERMAVSGNPDTDLISTSYIEKQNHTLRMHCRRLSRLTNAFSKKLENFKAAVALHYGYYNFVKIHKTIRCTPAMEAGVTTSPWTVANLVEMIEG
jgi:IS1 family transposase